MLKSLSIRAKISALALLAIVSAGALSGLSLYFMSITSHLEVESDWASQVIQAIGEVRVNQENFLNNVGPEAADKTKKSIELTERLLKDAKKHDERTGKVMANLEEYRQVFEGISDLSLKLKEMTAQQQRMSQEAIKDIRVKIIDGIEQKKTKAQMTGKDLGGMVDMLLGLGRDVLEAVERLQLDLTTLLLSKDLTAYQAAKADTYGYIDKTQKSITALLPTFEDKDLASAGQVLLGPIDQIQQLTNELVTKWEAREELNRKLQVTSTKLVETSLAFLKAVQAEINRTHSRVESFNTILAIIIVGLLIALGLLIPRSIIRVINKCVGLAEAIRKGDLSLRVNLMGRGEIFRLGQALDDMADSLSVKSRLAESIADGDLTQEVLLASDDDVLGQALQLMTSSLNQLVGQVQDSAAQLALGADQISDSSQALSQGATEQAASLEEVTSSMTEIGAQTRVNAENAAQAKQLALSAHDAAEKGNTHMRRMIQAMTEMNQSSREIAKIIKAIDEIAFQTNLLALNAAVEAARAGKHGKGFAVVAQEVRNLAARSAKAAQETAELIEGSVKKVEAGAGIVDQTAEALAQILGMAAKVNDLVGEIAAASNEQAQGIAQINQGLAQIDQVTQKNTAHAEQTASAVQELITLARQLQQLLTRFHLRSQKTASLEALSTGQTQVSGAPAAATQRSRPPAQRPERKDRALRPQDVISLDDKDFGKY